MKKLVIIESPFAGKTQEQRQMNIDYAWCCVRDSLQRGEAPFASHLFYPNVLNDDDPSERFDGMTAGWSWMRKADLVAVYMDLGMSNGMRGGIELAQEAHKEISFRSIKSPRPKPGEVDRE